MPTLLALIAGMPGFVSGQNGSQSPLFSKSMGRSLMLSLTPDELIAPAGSARVVLVAALGGNRRRSGSNLTRIEHNLRDHFEGWDCITLAYHTDTLHMQEHNSYIHGRCQLLLREGWQWASLVNLSRGIVRRRGYRSICLLLDDIALHRGSINTSALAERVMPGTGLGIISPRIHHATNGIMDPVHKYSGPVLLMSAIELYMAVYSRAAWECFSSLFNDEVLHDGNGTIAVGWGYDKCYMPHCSAITGKSALALDQKAHHTGPRGGLYHQHFGGLAGRQERRMQTWVAEQHNGSRCATYSAAPTPLTAAGHLPAGKVVQPP